MTVDKDQFLSGLGTEHRVALEKYLARKLDNPEAAAEVAQEAYLRLQRMREPEKLDNARAFLCQVATNINVGRRGASGADLALTYHLPRRRWGQFSIISSATWIRE